LSSDLAAGHPVGDIARIYRSLRLIRRAEEEIARIYPSDKIKSPVHLSIGQEAVAVGICDALKSGDAVSGTYRGHATYLAQGGDLNRMFAELYGKATGITGGKGGSMHLIDMGHNVLGTSAVVGTTIPIAAGFALAYKREGKGRMVAAFFGDGATEEGVFSETLNFAALHRLPILFVCENNGYAIHTPSSRRWATERLTERVATYGMPVMRIEDSDVFRIRSTAESMIANVRAGKGPAFLECLTYRWQEHVGPSRDYDAGYRSIEELEPWLNNDEVARVAEMLPPERRRQIDDEVEAALAAAIDFAETSPFPEPSALDDHVLAD
jgi:TPP-dependent pyruvate/acetoin dehydrogenase alpha subunit